MNGNDARSLVYHLQQVNENNRKFENAFQSLARMILEKNEIIEKVIVNGKSTYDFQIFRRGSKHVIGMFDEINSFVSCVKDAAEGGSSREMAFVLVGEPGNGKTFFVETLCALYRRFLSQEEDRRYTFNFKGLDRIGTYGKIKTIQSQTFEDPLILAMNLMPTEDEPKEFLARYGGFEDGRIDEFYRNYRPLGACSSYILEDIRNVAAETVDELLDFIEVDPDYDFMDNFDLVKAVTDVRLKSDIAGAGSLIGALANRTNEENQKLHDRMISTMLDKLGYCRTCAQKTIEYFCTKSDEN